MRTICTRSVAAWETLASRCERPAPRAWAAIAEAKRVGALRSRCPAPRGSAQLANMRPIHRLTHSLSIQRWGERRVASHRIGFRVPRRDTPSAMNSSGATPLRHECCKCWVLNVSLVTTRLMNGLPVERVAREWAQVNSDESIDQSTLLLIYWADRRAALVRSPTLNYQMFGVGGQRRTPRCGDRRQEPVSHGDRHTTPRTSRLASSSTPTPHCHFSASGRRGRRSERSGGH